MDMVDFDVFVSSAFTAQPDAVFAVDAAPAVGSPPLAEPWAAPLIAEPLAFIEAVDVPPVVETAAAPWLAGVAVIAPPVMQPSPDADVLEAAEAIDAAFDEMDVALGFAATAVDVAATILRPTADPSLVHALAAAQRAMDALDAELHVVDAVADMRVDIAERVAETGFDCEPGLSDMAAEISDARADAAGAAAEALHRAAAAVRAMAVHPGAGAMQGQLDVALDVLHARADAMLALRVDLLVETAEARAA